MPKSPQDVYARHLLSPRGYPLWMPEPSHQLLVYRRDGLRIGDVGVVIPEDGCFDVFFNICLPQGHPFHQATGVPDNFKPIELNDIDIRTAVNVENPGRIIANSSVKSVRAVERPADSSSSTRPSGSEYEFTLSSSEGALLILPEGAERHDLRNNHLFLEAATRYGADWYRFAEERVGQIIANDSLYLITGLYKTTSWSLAAFEKTTGTAEYPAQFRVSQAGGNNIAATYTWDTTRALEWRVGPMDKYEIPSQTVFIRGFKIALRTGVFRTRRISVKADAPSTRPNPARSVGAVPGGSWLGYVFGGLSSGRSTQPSGSGAQDEVTPNPALDDARNEIRNSGALAVGEHVAVQRIPEASQAFHPSDIINQYLLKKEPSANIAITHDDDWIAMLEENLLQPEELVQEGRLETLVSQKYDMILEEGTVYLQHRESSTLNADDVDAIMEPLELDPEDANAMVIDAELAGEQARPSCTRDGGQVNPVTTSSKPIVANQMTGVDPSTPSTKRPSLDNEDHLPHSFRLIPRQKIGAASSSKRADPHLPLRLSSDLQATPDPSIKPYACGRESCWPSNIASSRASYCTSRGLSDHNKTVHPEDSGGDRPYRCGLEGCGKSWKSINGLQYHLQISKAHSQHAITSSYVSSYISSLANPESVEASVSSEGEDKTKKLYKCPHENCPNRYKQLSGLRYHLAHGHPVDLPKQLDLVPPALSRRLAGKTPIRGQGSSPSSSEHQIRNNSSEASNHTSFNS